MKAVTLTILLILYLCVGVVWYILAKKDALKKKNNNLEANSIDGTIENGKVVVNSENVAQLDKVNKKTAIFNILLYFILFNILVSVVSSIGIVIYLKVNGIEYDLINPNSSLFDENVYNKMVVCLNPIIEIIIYGLAAIGIGLISKNILKEAFNGYTKKNFQFSLACVGFILVAGFVSSFIFTLFDINTSSSNQDAIEEMMFSSSIGLTITIIVTCILAPLVEELVFRKSIFDLIKDTNLAILISALLFGFLHVSSSSFSALTNMIRGEGNYLDFINELIQIIPYSLMGFTICYFYSLSKKNIATTIVAHAMYNTLSLILSIISYRLS